MRYQCLYKEDTLFDFGKYYGKTLREVEAIDPSYIVWAQKNVAWFCIEKEASQQLKPIHPTEHSNTKMKLFLAYFFKLMLFLLKFSIGSK